MKTSGIIEAMQVELEGSYILVQVNIQRRMTMHM